MTNDTITGGIQELTQEQIADQVADGIAINSGPAFFSNKIYATVSPVGMRLTFVEVNQAVPTPAYRTAVFLSIADTLALLELLQRQLVLTGHLVPVEKET